MSSISETLTVATEHHRAGRVSEAERLYREVLETTPDCAEALHLLGIVYLQSGRKTDAESQLASAVAASPDNPLFLVNHGHALHGCGRHLDAARSFARALGLSAVDAEAANKVNANALYALLRRYDADTRNAAMVELDEVVSDSDQRARLVASVLADG